MSDDGAAGAGRREVLLDAAIAVTAACSGAVVAWPAVRSLSPTSAAGARRGIVGRRGDFAPGTATVRAVEDRAVVVVSSADGELRAFDARCSHLGCVVGFDPASRAIACGCHGGRFGLDGRVLAGPPPAPLRALHLEIVDGDVHVEAG